VQDTVPTAYEGKTSAIGGIGYTSYAGLLDYKKAGDGTVVWLSTHGTVFMVR
jgi:NADPH-dependent curcumin reductase CurA